MCTQAVETHMKSSARDKKFGAITSCSGNHSTLQFTKNCGPSSDVPNNNCEKNRRSATKSQRGATRPCGSKRRVYSNEIVCQQKWKGQVDLCQTTILLQLHKSSAHSQRKNGTCRNQKKLTHLYHQKCSQIVAILRQGIN